MNSTLKKVVVIAIFALTTHSFDLKAQPPGPGGGSDEDLDCFPPPCVPIDGGLSWLLIAGSVYGGKKLYKANKEQKEKL